MLEGDDLEGRAFALFLRPHPGAFRQLMCPHPQEFAHFFSKKNANARGLARGWGAWALLELTDALHRNSIICVVLQFACMTWLNDL